MTAFQAALGLTTLSSDGAFAIDMACLFVPEYFDVALLCFTYRGSHQEVRPQAGRVQLLLLRAVSLRC